MGEIRLDNCCRLCLKEGFSLTNIFSHRSAAGDPLYRILSFIYDIKIFENDGLPSQICSPCMWRMIEFEAYKRNVRSAEAEILRLLNQARHTNEVSDHSAIFEAEETEMAPVKVEINGLEWEDPIETDMEGHIPEAVQKFEDDDYHGLESTEIEAEEIPVEEFQDNCNQQVFCQPLRESSQLSEFPNSLSLEDCDDTGRICLGESSSISASPENDVRIRETNKWTSEKDLRNDAVQAEESLSAEQPKGFVNVTEPGPSHLEAPFSKMNKMFTCDFCKKSFQCKSWLGRHIKVHYDYRLFSCSVCSKSFKQHVSRHQHELRHLKDKTSIGKSEMGSKKKQYTCGICGKNFCSKTALCRHSNQHSNKFSCSCCGRCFGNNNDLKKHYTVHSKEKPFKCEKCSKSFKVKGNLTRHVVIHSSDTPFSCRFCEKKFKLKYSRNEHELFHLNKKHKIHKR